MPLSNTGVDRFLAQNYYSKTQLNAGQLDNLYYGEDEFIATSAGAGDAGKPVKLDAAGHIDASMINDADVDHGGLGGLTDDDHTQYALLLGRSGGQTIIGGTASGNGLTLKSSSHATKGLITFGTASAYDEVNDRFGIGLTNPTYRFDALVGSGSQNILRAGQSGVSNGLTITSTGSVLSYTLVTGKLTVAAAATGYASLNLPSGTAPSSPAAGDIWYDGTFVVRDGSASRILVTRDRTETLTNKTLTAPTIGAAEWSNANHAHEGAGSGGTISHTALTNIGTNTHTVIDSHIAATTGHGATGAVVGTTNTQTLTNKTLTDPIVPTLYGSAAANGDITLYGTSHATKASSYVLLNPTSGGVGIGVSDPGGANFVVGDGSSTKLFIFDPDGASSGPKLTAYDTGGATTTTLEIAASVLTLNPGAKGLIFGANTTPSSAADTGTAGAFCWDSSYIYIAVGTNTWKRAALSTW